MEQLEINKEVNTDKAWTKVHNRLQEDGLISEQAETVRIESFPRWIPYAATFLVILAIGSLSYFLFFDLLTPRLITLQTGTDNSTFVQTLEDGSIVYMSDNTVINYPKVFRGGERKIFFSGEAFFDISNNSDQPFVIETNHALFQVIGTAFNVKSYDDVFELIVESGLVKVTLRGLPDQSEIVGEWEMLTGFRNSFNKSPVVDRTYLSWRMSRMQFRDEKLDNITSVISRNYNVIIDFEDEAIRERRLTVTFHNNEINTIAEVIAFSMGLDYNILSDSSLVFRDK